MVPPARHDDEDYAPPVEDPPEPATPLASISTLPVAPPAPVQEGEGATKKKKKRSSNLPNRGSEAFVAGIIVSLNFVYC